MSASSIWKLSRTVPVCMKSFLANSRAEEMEYSGDGTVAMSSPTRHRTRAMVASAGSPRLVCAARVFRTCWTIRSSSVVGPAPASIASVTLCCTHGHSRPRS